MRGSSGGSRTADRLPLRRRGSVTGEAHERRGSVTGDAHERRGSVTGDAHERRGLVAGAACEWRGSVDGEKPGDPGGSTEADRRG